ncbi:Aerobic respiration control sensor protein ArcB [Legionella busanensis]|uniref:histidine kinase n=1 Tax=Legionella busanensis TaxID=190655 RepID=A0A378JHG4_9GAMM|nr:ATP-binding protein [Legionella busanensis]STX50746.1 Aerobic respiration control sensor protein ArcB [Legionella busanensis]
MAYIIILNRKGENKRQTLYTPNIILSLLMFTMFIFGVPWKISYFLAVGIFQFIDTLLEAAGFALATICLARSKSHLVSFITIGYLIIVSSDFIIRYCVISRSIPYLSPFEATWVLGLLIICLGFYLSFNEEKTKILKLMPLTSLQSQLTIWSLILWLGSLLLFVTWNYLFTKYSLYNQITKGFLSTLVPISVLVIIGSHFLSAKISSTLSKLENITNRFIETDNVDISDLKKQVEDINQFYITNEKFSIYEVEKLCKFIMNTVTELQLANRVKADFLMKMSHDFRTPASRIYSMSRSIYKRIEDPKLKRLQQLVIQSSEQLMNILEDVLDYSRLDSNQYKLSIKTIDIKSIINEVILLVSAKAEEKKLVVSSHYPNLPIYYNTDRLVIHRIVLNIVSNAIKFTRIGGVTICLNFEEFEQKEWIVITIKDTGIGIDKKYHASIFEPFTCIESPETSKYSGIGLGLSNALLMIKKMDGKIILKSTLNQGATFKILLPF